MEPKEQLDQAETIRDKVREGYGRIARSGGSCCSPSCCGSGMAVEVAKVAGYSEEELALLPAGANMGLSCPRARWWATTSPAFT